MTETPVIKKWKCNKKGICDPLRLRISDRGPGFKHFPVLSNDRRHIIDSAIYRSGKERKGVEGTALSYCPFCGHKFTRGRP